jgi:uncharacterized delta-60 repeat protein
MGQRSGRRRASSALLSTALLCTFVHTIATAPQAAAATTIHVPADQPTISAALVEAVAGDTIEVAPGIYRESIDFAGKDVHVVGSGGALATTIDPPSTDGVRIGPGGSLRGFTLTGASRGAVTALGAGSVIADNRFRANAGIFEGAAGVLADGASPSILRNLFSGNSCSSGGSVLINVLNAASPLIANNVIVDNYCRSAISLSTPVGFQPRVINNTIIGGEVGIEDDGVAGATHVIRNNILAETYEAINLNGAGPGNAPTVENNLFHQNQFNFRSMADMTGMNGNITGAPRFIDAGSLDFRLDATSPALDAGAASEAPGDDFDGSIRPHDGPDLDTDAEVDIGAHERDGSEPPPVPQTGVVDEGWSTDGILELPNDYFVPMAAEGSDRLFTASYREAESLAKYRVSKYEPSGSLSPGFGTNGSGTILRDFSIGGTSFPILLEPAGAGLLVVGEHYTTSRSRLGVARLKPDGTYDTSFSGDGRALYKVFSGEHDVVTAFRARVLNGGKIGLAVAAFDYDSHDVLRLTGQSILRLNANGSADTSFSTDARIPLTTDYSDISFNPSGSAYAGRQVGSVHQIHKFSAAGPRDKVFSGDGIVSVSCGTHRGANLTSDPSGRPVLMCVRVTNGTLNLGLFRFTTTGAVDNTYSGDGKTALVTTGGSAIASTWALAFDAQSRPWAAIESDTNSEQFLVFSLNASGGPNTAWSGDGKATVTMPSAGDFGGLEKGSGRLYVEEFPGDAEHAVRITALSG